MRLFYIGLLGLLMCITNISLFSQATDSSVIITEGYIVKVIEKLKWEEQQTKSVDYLFFKEQPKIDKKENPLSLYDLGGQLIDITIYRSENFARTMTEGYIQFDGCKRNVLKEVDTKSFNFQIYKVLMACSISSNTINSITSKNETSHSYSYFKNMADDKLIEKTDIIYPFIIDSFVQTCSP